MHVSPASLASSFLSFCQLNPVLLSSSFFFSFFLYVCLPHRPVLKFSVIKLVVLVMWWQGVFVNVLEQQPAMKEADDGLLKRGWTSKEVGFCIQNFLCIIEMLFIGIGFHYAFHYTVGEQG